MKNIKEWTMTDNDIIFELVEYLNLMRDRKHGNISDDQHLKVFHELMALLEEDEKNEC